LTFKHQRSTQQANLQSDRHGCRGVRVPLYSRHRGCNTVATAVASTVATARQSLCFKFASKNAHKPLRQHEFGDGVVCQRLASTRCWQPPSWAWAKGRATPLFSQFLDPGSAPVVCLGWQGVALPFARAEPLIARLSGSKVIDFLAIGPASRRPIFGPRSGPSRRVASLRPLRGYGLDGRLRADRFRNCLMATLDADLSQVRQ
jgi:hypothetical protein